MIKDSENGILKTLDSPIEMAQQIMVILDGQSHYGARTALKIAAEMLEFRRLTDIDIEFDDRAEEMARRHRAMTDRIADLREKIEVMSDDKPPKKLLQ
jgi:hypothetical protein